MKRRDAEARPAFALAFVLMLMLIASVMIAAGLQRTTSQAGVFKRRADGYHEYHELMSIVDIVEYWATEMHDPGDIADIARQGDQHAVIKLKENLRLELRVSDAQGTILARMDRVPDDDRMGWMYRAIMSFGDDVDRLTRKAGPFQISFNAADQRVITALADGDSKLLEALLIARARNPESAADFKNFLMNESIPAEVADDLNARYVTFTPSIVRISAVLHSPYIEEKTRYYTLLAELRGRSIYFYEWKKVKSLAPGPGPSTSR